ncbi:MAG: hypothetical protein CMJ13_00960 [Pelagibacterales bacterium]|nr:hypothetical protein [Pelagibacterales bacterium]
MKFILKQLINYSIFFTIIFLINSCAHFRIINLEKSKYDEHNFFYFLSQEYLSMAKFELYDMHDEIDANLFAYKASLSIKQNIFYPENPENWKIPSNYKSEAFLFYEEINDFINKKIYLKYPKKFSKVITAYDCWIEQIEENWQTDHIKACYDKFNQNLEAIRVNISELETNIEDNITDIQENIAIDEDDNNSQVSVKEPTNTKIKKAITEKNKENKVKVFFEFDKFTLSADQIIELEYFIDIALKNSSMEVLIEAHTDTMGSKTYNDNLSKKRANYIKKYLIKRNLENIIITKSYGESNPFIITNDEVKEKKNRRAELYLK